MTHLYIYYVGGGRKTATSYDKTLHLKKKTLKNQSGPRLQWHCVLSPVKIKKGKAPTIV